MIAEKIENVGKMLLDLSKSDNNQSVRSFLQIAVQELMDASNSVRNLEKNLIVPGKAQIEEGRNVQVFQF